MANADEPILLDAMIARLEKANARAYERFSVQSEGISKLNEDRELHPTDHVPAAPAGQSSRAGQSLIALIALLLAACAIALAWEPSYGEAAKRFGRWANPWVFQSLTHAQTALWEGSPAASPISPDIAQRLQTMADRLANMEQEVEQLKANQQQTIRSDRAVSEQFKASPKQTALDNAEVVEQLNAALVQLDRQSAAVARQVRANQEQLADLASRGRYGWKHPRRNPSR